MWNVGPRARSEETAILERRPDQWSVSVLGVGHRRGGVGFTRKFKMETEMFELMPHLRRLKRNTLRRDVGWKLRRI